MQVVLSDGVNDQPVDGVVVVHGNVSEINGFFEVVGQGFLNDARFTQKIKSLSHRGGSGQFGCGNEVRPDIDTELYRTA